MNKTLAHYLYTIISALVTLNSIAVLAAPFDPAKAVATPAAHVTARVSAEPGLF